MIRRGELTAREAEEIVDEYARDSFDIDIPDAIEVLDAEMEWRSEVESVDVYLSGEYEGDRNFVYRLLSRFSRVEDTTSERYRDSVALRDMDLEDFVEIGEDYGLD